MLKMYYKIHQFFSYNRRLISLTLTALVVSIFTSRFLSLNKLPLGIATNHWEWGQHGPYLGELALIVYSIIFGIIFTLIVVFFKSKRFWFLFPVFVALFAFIFSFIFYRIDYMQEQMSLVGNAGYAVFGNMIADSYSLLKGIAKMNIWVANFKAEVNFHQQFNLYATHIAMHPPGGWVIYWLINKVLNTNNLSTLGYAKIALNIILTLLGLYALKNTLSKKSITILSLLLMLSPGFIFFGTDPAISVSVLMFWIIIALLKLHQHVIWAIVLGVSTAGALFINFANLSTILLIGLSFLFIAKNQGGFNVIKKQIYYFFIILIVFFLLLKVLGYDYLLGIILGQMHNHIIIDERLYNFWFLFNLYDILLFLGLGFSSFIVILFNSPKDGTDSYNLKLLDFLFLINIVIILLMDISGQARGETGRIYYFTTVPFLFYAAVKVESLIHNNRQFITTILLLSILSVHQLMMMSNIIIPINGPQNIESQTRTLLQKYKIPGAIY